MLCQQTSPKRWFANANMTSYCGVTNNSVYPVTMTTMVLCHCSILEFGRGASNQTVAPGITRPLHATVHYERYCFILVTCNMNAKCQAGNENILTVTRLKEESPSKQLSKVGPWVVIQIYAQSQQACVLRCTS